MTQTTVIALLSVLIRIVGIVFGLLFTGGGLWVVWGTLRRNTSQDALSSGDSLGIGCFMLMSGLAICLAIWFEGLPK
jgi:hypothetical protein